MVASTISGVRLPCICFRASLAFSIAINVSRLMLADSIAFICCSNVPICAMVWSRLCSCCFLRFSAVFAAITKQLARVATEANHFTETARSHNSCCLQ